MEVTSNTYFHSVGFSFNHMALSSGLFFQWQRSWWHPWGGLLFLQPWGGKQQVSCLVFKITG